MRTAPASGPRSTLATLFPLPPRAQPGWYCVVRTDPVLPRTQCRRAAVFADVRAAARYRERSAGLATEELTLERLCALPERELRALLGLPERGTAGAPDTGLPPYWTKPRLTALIAGRRSRWPLSCALGPLQAVLDAANELGVLYAGLPLDDPDEDEERGRRDFADAGEPCRFAPTLWAEPRWRFVKAGFSVGAPGCYDVGRWLLLDDPRFARRDPSEQWLMRRAGIEPPEEGEEDDAVSVLESVGLAELQTELDPDEAPFAGDYADEVDVQAAMRRTPRTRAYLELLRGMELRDL